MPMYAIYSLLEIILCASLLPHDHSLDSNSYNVQLRCREGRQRHFSPFACGILHILVPLGSRLCDSGRCFHLGFRRRGGGQLARFLLRSSSIQIQRVLRSRSNLQLGCDRGNRIPVLRLGEWRGLCLVWTMLEDENRVWRGGRVLEASLVCVVVEGLGRETGGCGRWSGIARSLRPML